MPEPRPSRRWPKVVGAIVVVLLALLAVGVIVLDRVLLSQARKQADALSQDLGRPIAIGDVSTKLWGGVGVKVTDVSVGAGEGEEVPLAELRRGEVDVRLWRALRTLGEEVHVREAVLEGLRLNVVKLPDGTTNLERLAKALEDAEPAADETPPAQAPAEPDAEPPLRALQVDRAAVEDARIAFLDRTRKGAQELAVADLDVEVRDLETGKPLVVTLRAGVLAERQNLELRLTTAPLGPALEVVPEEVVLKVEPIVLDPLAPFVPADVGFRGGRIEADLEAKLGAAVPGGAGETRVKGGFRATGLAFAGQEGGRPFDARLDADLEADVAAGDLRIGKLELVAGPATLTGKGSASGLRSDSPRFEGLEIVGEDLDPAAIAAYFPPLRAALGENVVAGPIGLLVRGSGSGEAQTARARIDLTPVRLVVPGQLAKAAGAPLVATLDAVVSGGGERVRFEASADLGGVDLRPGGTVAKKPGDPLSVKAAGSYRAEGETSEIQLDRLDLALLADRLSGKGELRLAGSGRGATTRFAAELRGERLDLDRLLLSAPEPPKAKGEAPAEEPLDPAAFEGLSGTAALRLGALRMKGMEARDVAVNVVVEGDEVRLEEARLVAFGGTVSAAGTHLALARRDAPFEVALDLRGVAGEEVLKLLGDREVIAGKLDAAVKLGGKGIALGLLSRSVTGVVDGTLRNGAFLGKDLVASVAAPLAAKLPFAASRLPEGGSTSLGKELPFGFRIADGTAMLTEPLRAETGQGTLSVEGGVRLDGTVELPATLALSPELVSRLTGGRAKPKAPIPVTFRLAGPAWRPQLEALQLEGAVRAIADQAAAGAIGRAVGVEGESVKDIAAKKRAEAEARAREEAEKKRRELEEEAKERLRGLLGK